MTRHWQGFCGQGCSTPFRAGSVPRNQSAVLEPIGSGMNKNLPTGDQYVIVSEGEATIDGIEMKNVIFQGYTLSTKADR
jgi:hypothetical protein